MGMQDASRAFALDEEGVREDVEGALADVRRICANEVVARSLGERALQAFEASEQTIRRRMREGFQLVVVGEFKRGKSTLINALLGEELVPTAVTPETLTWNRISHAEQEEVRLVLTNRRSVRVSREDLRRKNLRALLGELPAPLDYVDIRSASEFLREVTLVDTPGLDDISSEFSDQVAERLAHADAIIYVVSALAPLSQSEVAFLSSAVVPQGFSRVFLVVNMSDLLETEDNVEVIERDVERKALPVSDRMSVHMLSALDEYRRRTGGERPCPGLAQRLEDDFLAFESELERDVLLQKSLIRAEREVSLTVLYLEEVASRIRLTRELIDAGLDDLEARVGSFESSDETFRRELDEQKREVAEKVQDMRREAVAWMRAYLDRMRGELQGLGDETSLSDIERYVQFYIMDGTRDAVMACVRQHERELNDLLLTRSSLLSAELTSGLSKGVQATVADSIRDYSWTGADNVVFVGTVLESLGFDLTSGILAPFNLVAQSVAGAVRLRTVSRQQKEVLAPVVMAFDKVEVEVLRSLDEIYGKLSAAAQAKLDEVAERQMEVSREALENVRAVMADEGLRSQDAKRELDAALEVVERDLAQMRQLQAE